MDSEEYLEIVNKDGEVTGLAARSEVHGNPSMLHKVVHVLVFNSSGSLLLQKRSANKDVAPGMWDTSVGGHVSAGEDILFSARREMEEELGVVPQELEYLYAYIHSNPYETELVNTYRCTYDGEISFNREEIDEVRFWKLEEIRQSVGKGRLSSNFEHEFRIYINSQTPRVSGS